MANLTVKVRYKMAWWVKPYIKSCILFAKMFNLTPNINKIRGTALKGCSVCIGEVVKNE